MKWKNLYNYILIGLLTFAIYGKTLSFEFNLDDEYVTAGNERVEKGFAGISEILKGYYYEDAMGYKFGYRPVSQISFAIEYHFLGINPYFSHFINVLLYILICSLIFYFLNKYAGFKNKYLPLVITLVFLVHPLHVEAVASIKNREELLAFLFPFSALLIALKAIDSKKWYLFLIAAIFNFLAIYSKQSSLVLIVSFPFLIIFIRRLNYFYLSLSFVSFFPFAFLAISDSLELNKFALLLLLSSFSFFVFSKIFHEREKIGIWLKKIPLDFAVFFFVIIGSTFCLFIRSDFYLLLSIFPLLLLLKNKDSFFLKLAALMPIVLFLILNEIFWFLNIVVLFIYVFEVFSFKKLQFKNEWGFIFIFIFISVIRTIIENEIDVSGLLFSIFLLLRLGNLKLKKFSNLFLFIHPVTEVINYKNLSSSPIEFIAFLLTLFILIKAYSIGSKLPKNLKYKSAVFFFITSVIALFSYDNIYIFSDDKEYNATVFNENYQHQNISYAARIIDKTENPYYYYTSKVAQNGLSLSSCKFYLQKSLIPYPLSSYYGYNVIQTIENPYIQMGVLLVFILIFIGLLYLFRKNVFLVWNMFFLVLILVSVSNYFMLIPGIVADRLSFALILPFAIILFSFIDSIFKNLRVQYVLSITVILVLGVSSLVRVPYWESPVKLFSKDVKSFPNSAKLNSLVATHIMQEQFSNSAGYDLSQVEIAKTHFEKSIEIYPEYFNSFYDLARVNEILKDYNSAIINYENVVRIDKDFYDVYLDLADLYLESNNIQKAALNLDKYLSYYGFDLEYYFQLSSLVYQLGDYNKVVNLNQEIIQNNPQIPEAYLNIAYAYGMLKNKEKLIEYLKLGEKIAPNHQDIKIIKKMFL